MWVINSDGFYSVVNKDVKEGELLVRARLQEDIERLAKRLSLPLEHIAVTKMADYWYRLTVPVKEFGEYLAKMAEEIDYDNFKSSLSHKTAVDKERSRAYMKIWSALYEIQR